MNETGAYAIDEDDWTARTTARRDEVDHSKYELDTCISALAQRAMIIEEIVGGELEKHVVIINKVLDSLRKQMSEMRGGVQDGLDAVQYSR